MMFAKLGRQPHSPIGRVPDHEIKDLAVRFLLQAVTDAHHLR